MLPHTLTISLTYYFRQKCQNTYKKSFVRLQSDIFGFFMVENIYFETKIIQIGPLGQILW